MGEIILSAELVFLESENELFGRLDRRRGPRRKEDSRERLLSQWRQTMAMSSVWAKKLIADQPYVQRSREAGRPQAPLPNPNRPSPGASPHPRPPIPPRPTGPITVQRIRKSPAERVALKIAELRAQKAVTRQPVIPAASEPPRTLRPAPSRARQIAQAAAQTAGTIFAALALGTAHLVATWRS